jgi:hypothetical protein
MAISEQDVMEDLAYAEAEGSAEMTDMMEGDFYEDEDSADFTGHKRPGRLRTWAADLSIAAQFHVLITSILTLDLDLMCL